MLVSIIINITSFANITINMIVKDRGLSNFIITDRDLVFILKF